MFTKSSKSLSRKELLLEYSKLRDLYEVQQDELSAKNKQIHILVEGAGRRETTITVDGDVDNPKFREDTVLAIEANLKQRFEIERQEMIEKLQRLHSINVRLVERIMRMQESEQQAQPTNDEKRDDSIPRISRPGRKRNLNPVMIDSAA